MKITDTNWCLICESIEKKRELFRFAEMCGVPTNAAYGCDFDPDLTLVWFDGIWSEEYVQQGLLITETDYKQMCRDYVVQS